MSSRLPEAPPAAAAVDACVASLATGGNIPSSVAELTEPQLVEAYRLTMDTMAETIRTREGLPSEAHIARIHALGLTSCILARRINNVTTTRATDALFIEARTWHPRDVRLVSGVFDFFGVLYRREVDALYEGQQS